ncbi:hypothetical protein BU26DRAFT_324410 [Trematosphaeria pertusa]|uniref:Uncharacterized protein n=1 Tax=Trematosphaeria pertusa TaxID=390896 RepID=A0A6A6IBL0_9PLEO|nr:uncharacterized protein BU26DRAFT_324410 [Trematosphaeria pertusa]KAF2247954.1 hypothetical protein BU26DRAFT_324410 [Trematosphaeria pertusa]
MGSPFFSVRDAASVKAAAALGRTSPRPARARRLTPKYIKPGSRLPFKTFSRSPAQLALQQPLRPPPRQQLENTNFSSARCLESVSRPLCAHFCTLSLSQTRRRVFAIGAWPFSAADSLASSLQPTSHPRHPPTKCLLASLLVSIHTLHR